MKRRSSNFGFTLLELLLALTMTVVLMAALGSSLYVAFHAKDSAEAAINRTRKIDLVGDVFVREMANVLPPTPETQDLASTLMNATAAEKGIIIGAFYGTPNAVEFFTCGPEPWAKLHADVRQVQYLLLMDITRQARGRGTSQVLVRRVYPNILSTANETAPDEIVCRDVVRFELQYYDGTSWYTDWDSTLQNNALPTAVRLYMEILPEDSDGTTVQKLTRIAPIICATSSATVEDDTAATAAEEGGP